MMIIMMMMSTFLHNFSKRSSRSSSTGAILMVYWQVTRVTSPSWAKTPPWAPADPTD
jgi:hypothetical protein